MTNNSPIIDQIVSIIVDTVAPDQIMLFGSYARGDYTEKSDVDILILKKGLTKRRELITNLYRIIYNDDNDIDIDVDLLAIDYDRYNEIKHEIGYVYNNIRKEGKVIYGII
jgi:predicted nucleotidyltransferase